MRKLATAAAVSLALASGGAKALILGEIEMRSALNQPMNAEISLSSIVDGELDGMIVKIASPEAFARAGIERTQALADLRFVVSSDNNGQPVILVNSKKPVLEPFLNFLLEVEWTRGRMVREYTVLLDPPVFMTPNATQRSTAADTPAIVQAPTDNSLLTPLPIDRSNGTFDDSSVVVVGDATEVADLEASEAVDLNNIDLGESVSLDELSASDELGEVVELGDLAEVDDSLGAVANAPGTVLPAPGTEIDSEIVTLTDIDVENPQSVTFSDESSFDPSTGWDVQVMGDTSEVSDDVGLEVVSADIIDLGTESEVVDLAGELDSETVSLDEVAGAGSTNVSGQVAVNKNDTLWEIAKANNVLGMSIQQMMLALLEANQSAFINGNINLVKAGAILRIPQPGEGTSLTQAEAVAQVNSQEQLWREYRDNLRGVNSTTQVASSSQSTERTESSVADPTESTVAGLVANSETSTESASSELVPSVDQSTEGAANDLTIVADNSSTSTVASTNADETEAPDTERLGSVNQELQLAQEELAATRLESSELAEQDSELKDLTENMDQLVSVQQDQLAKLQAQLADARDNAAATAGDLASDATDTVANATDQAADAVVDAGTDLVANAGDTVNQVADTDTVATVVPDATVAAVDATGTSLSDLQNATNAVTPGETVATQGAWYEDLMSDKKAVAGGFGALAAGLLGWTLWRRRKRDDDYAEEDLDQVAFIDDDVDANINDGEESSFAGDLTDGEGAVAAAGVAAGTAAMAGAADEIDNDATVNLDATLADDTGSDDTISKDDTISEAEVYLAYGLHGQAEDLLKKAIEKKPDSEEYNFKLLQTYHAQGNSVAFEEAAGNYHENFGAAAQNWDAITEMGKSLDPANELYTSTGSGVASIGVGDFDGPKMDFDDFTGGEGDQISSQVREFSSSDEGAVDMVDDESSLMDQSLDPAFAFDESDLEATGDFTQIANELKDDINDSGLSAKVGGAAAALTGAAGMVASESSESASVDSDILEFDMPDLKESSDDSHDLSALEESASANDLTMDLDQLTQDLDMDTTELLGGAENSLDSAGLDMTHDLEIPDLTSNTDLTADASAAFGSVDEMDTMMDLAKAYIDMGDKDSASSALDEIVKSGSPEQKTEAENLLRKIS